LENITPLEFDELSEEVRNLLPLDSPFAIKFRAASALLPFMSRDLIASLFFLSFDDDKRVSDSAMKSLRELPDYLIIPVLTDPKTSPKILSFFGISMPDKDSVVEAVALNPSTENDVFAKMGRMCRNERFIEIFSQNQNRLIEFPKIIDELKRNPLTPRSTIERMVNFYRLHTGRDYKEDIEDYKEVEEEAVDSLPPEPIFEEVKEERVEISDQEELATVEEYVDETDGLLSDDLPPDFTVEDILKQDINVDELFAEELLVDPELELSSEKRESLENKIRKMRVVEKMQLGLKGNIEARNILMKSPNKMIQECVLSNPKLSIDEVIRYARTKSMREELIRIIAGNREWTKNYQVKINLIWNPKTPMTQSMKWLSTVTAKDLEKLGKSKQIPGMLAVSARKALQHKKRFH